MERVVLLLLLLPVCCGHSDYQGKVMTYYTLETYSDGSVLMVIRYKSNSKRCYINNNWCPPDGCFQVSYSFDRIYYSAEGFCQFDSIWTRNASSQAPFMMKSKSDLWTSPIVNEVTVAGASIVVDLRKRSDTGQANRCPQTTILPVFRVPYNCPRDIQLLSFDPDGDLVQCRFANDEIDPAECANCTLPSVLSLSSSCTLSFRLSSSSSQGRYAVQLVMEDFPRTQITLSQTNGQQEVKDNTTSISKIPVQFLFLVEDAAPSCTLGRFLPEFIPPTPEHGTEIGVQVHETVDIQIEVQAEDARAWELLLSGPSRINVTGSGGHYVLTWTPDQAEDGQSHPVCFSAQAFVKQVEANYTSRLRCVIITVGKVVNKVWLLSPAPLPEEALRSALVKKVKMELVKLGLRINVSLVNRILKSPPAKSPPAACQNL
ncbi:hypothetical protein WMY93_014712 [Mugilogobius chulae]|uniref:Uncharacterized protein n=1 Tax=Mugilogobius chulae TaxID=88201 RepID=A0AAW0P007_9GOBI